MLKVTRLRKVYDSVVAVDGISLEVHRGELFGLLGPNGAGKTTTIRTILNIIIPDSGTITFDGKTFNPEMWNIIGYLPEERGLYRKSKVINAILYFASLKGLAEREARPRAHRWLERFGLADGAHRKVEELSKGNQQKVQFIISILHQPQLLILDEPFSGLDPVNQILLKDILMELRLQNVAIVFSTHQMEQVEKMCDNICLINKGKIVLDGSLREIKQRYGMNSVHLEFEGDGSFLKELPMVRRADVYQNYAELELNDIQNTRDLLSSLDNRLSLRKFEVVEPSLNSIFIHVVGGTSEGAGDQRPAPPPAVKPLPPRKTDPRLRKAIFSFLLVAAVTAVLVVANLFSEDPSWGVPGVLAAATLYSAFQYLRAKKAIERQSPPRSRGGGR